ncbi:hypothetical protein [Methylomonas sp. MgM2]
MFSDNHFSRGQYAPQAFLYNPDKFVLAKRQGRAWLAFTTVTLVLSGCASYSGAPKAIVDVDAVVESLISTDKEKKGKLQQWSEKPPSECKDIRDATNNVMTAIDLRYAEFVDDISFEGKIRATATDIALTGLGLAGTAVGGAGAKTVFNALSAGIAATNTSIDKNFFYEKTIPALIAKMNADRKAQQLLIIKRLKTCKNPGDYLWFEAIHDLTDYYATGTLLGAIASISKDAGAKQVNVEDNIQQEILRLRPSKKSADKDWLHNYFSESKENQKKILKCWKEVGTPQPDAFDDATDLFQEPFASDIPKVRQCLEKQKY